MIVRLDPVQLEELAELVADRLAIALAAGERRSVGGLVDAATVAARLGLTRDFVYRNAERLGAVRVGDGARPRLRFDLAEVVRRLDACSGGRESEGPAGGVVEPIRARQRRRRSGTRADLLPIRGGEDG